MSRFERLVLYVLLAGLWGVIPSHAVEGPNGPLVPSLSAAATDETPGAAVDQGMRCRESVVYVEWAEDVSAGAVRFETARTTGYGGIWSVQGTPLTFSGSNPDGRVSTFHITGTYAAVRTTVDAAVTGGGAPSVSTWIGCN